MEPFGRDAAAIDTLKELPSGWDSYAASPIGVSVREHAKTFLGDLVRICGPSYTSPVVGPTADTPPKASSLALYEICMAAKHM